jgi:hypothetical protein
VRRWWVTLALLLSLGINLGLLAAVAAGRWADRREAAEEPPPAPALRGDDRELAGELGGEMIVEVPAGEPLDATAPADRAAASGAEPDPGGPAARAPGGEPRQRQSVAPAGASFAGAEDAPAPDVHDPTEAAPGGRGPHRRIGSHGPGGAPGEPPLGRLADHLGLAGERRERFIALQRGFVRAHLQARGERARLGAALRQELVAQVPDAARIDELIAGLGETYLASERATAEVVLASRELLDDEQRRTYLRFLQRLRHDGPHGAPYDGPRPGGRRRHR